MLITLTQDDADCTPAALGIRNDITVERNNQEPDRVVLSLLADVDAASLWTFGEKVTIKADGAPIFKGYAQKPSVTGSEGDESRTIELLGEWWQLDRLQYVYYPPGNSNPFYADISGRRRMYVDQYNNAMTSRAMLQELVNYAQQRGIAVGSEQVGAMDEDLYPPAEEVVDRSVAELLRMVLRYHLEIALRFTRQGVFSLAKRGHAVTTYTIGEAPLVSFALRSREDLAPSGVFIRYEDRGSAQSASGLKTLRGNDFFPGGARPGEPGVITETVQIEPGEPIPAGLAHRYYQMFRGVNEVYEGEIVLKSEECDTEHLPGDTIKILGGVNGRNEITAFVQSVREHLNSGTTTLTVGLPAYLDLRSYLDLRRLRLMRTRDANDGDTFRTTVNVPTTPLTCYQDWVDNVPVLRVTPGEVTNGQEAMVPTWDTSSTPLTSTPAPYTAILPGVDYDVWLFVEFEPDTRQFGGTDADGVPVVEYLAVGTGTIERAQIKFNVSSDFRAPVVDPESGFVTSMRFYKRIGHVNWTATGQPVPTVSAITTGDMQFMFVPPAHMYVFNNNG